MDGSVLARFAAAGAILVSSTSSALAGVGVGVGTTVLTIDAPVVPGRSYRIRPDFQVLNTGDGVTTYTFRVERLSKQDGMTLTPSWIAFNPDRRTLRPRRAARIAITLRLPQGTHPGTYVSDVVATGSETGPGTETAKIGVAAATPIRFTIGGGRTGLAAALGWPWPLWTDITAIVAAGLLILFAGWRKLGFHIVVERNRR